MVYKVILKGAYSATIDIREELVTFGSSLVKGRPAYFEKSCGLKVGRRSGAKRHKAAQSGAPSLPHSIT